jgi:hypothetical protein
MLAGQPLCLVQGGTGHDGRDALQICQQGQAWPTEALMSISLLSFTG